MITSPKKDYWDGFRELAIKELGISEYSPGEPPKLPVLTQSDVSTLHPNYEKMLCRLNELSPSEPRHRPPKVIDHADLKNFESRFLPPPKGYWIEDGDFLSSSVMTKLGKYSKTQLSSLFYSKGKYQWEVECEICSFNFIKTGPKTTLIDDIHVVCGRYRYGTGANKTRICSVIPEGILCQDCYDAKKLRSEIERKNQAAKYTTNQKEQTEKYIQTYLNPQMGWKKSSYKNFYEVRDMFNVCDQDELSRFIRNLPYKGFLNTPYWKACAIYVKHKSHFRCQLCNEPNNLHVHHRSYECHGYEHCNLTELICLCNKCHAKHHDKVVRITE